MASPVAGSEEGGERRRRSYYVLSMDPRKFNMNKTDDKPAVPSGIAADQKRAGPQGTVADRRTTTLTHGKEAQLPSTSRDKPAVPSGAAADQKRAGPKGTATDRRTTTSKHSKEAHRPSTSRDAGGRHRHIPSRQSTTRSSLPDITPRSGNTATSKHTGTGGPGTAPAKETRPDGTSRAPGPAGTGRNEDRAKRKKWNKQQRERRRAEDREDHRAATTARGPTKRPRLNDSSSPRVAAKRVARMATSTSYAEVAKLEGLSVALTTVPQKDMTAEQAMTVKKELESLVMAEIASLIAADSDLVPRFDGKPRYTGGVLKTRVMDEETLQWLKGLVHKIPSPVSNTTMTVVREEELEKKIRCGLVIPHGQKEITGQRILDYLAFQNKALGIQRWNLRTCEPRGADQQFISVNVPEDLIPAIVKAQRKLSLVCGSVYLRFFGKGGRLYDTPQPREDASHREAATLHPETAPRQEEKCSAVKHVESLPIPTQGPARVPSPADSEHLFTEMEELLLRDEGEEMHCGP